MLQCSFSLFYSKSNPVKSTIQATLRQLMTIVMEAFVHRCRQVPGFEESADLKKAPEADSLAELLRIQ